jgi:hypothetical protein
MIIIKMNNELQIDNPKYLQLRFRVEYENEACEVFATAPKSENPSQDLITIHMLGVVGDVMISPEDLDEDAFRYFQIRAYEHWKYEVS